MPSRPSIERARDACAKRRFRAPRAQLKAFGMLALALLALACGDIIAPPPRAKKPIASQAQAPAPPAAPAVEDGLQLIDAQGLFKHVRDSGRKATIVNVWASWCGSCKRELPM